MNKIYGLMCVVFSLIMLVSIFGCDILSSNAPAEVKGMFIGTVSQSLAVEIIPTDKAVANTKYTVQLFEDGNLRDAKTISFNQPQINVKYSQTIYFPLAVNGANYRYSPIHHDI